MPTASTGTGSVPFAEYMRQHIGRETDRLRERLALERVEFMHTKDMHENLEHYEMRKQRGQIDRYQRAIWRMQNPNTLPIFTDTFISTFSTRREHHLGGSNGYTEIGTYGRINNTFIVHVSNTAMVEEITRHINNYGHDRLDRAARGVRENYVHDTRNTNRDINWCNSYNYWAVDSYNSEIFTYDRLRLVCLGCGVTGGLNI